MKASIFIATSLDSGKTIQWFLIAGLFYQMTITIIPDLIGIGIPFYGPTNQDKLKEELQPAGLCNICIK